MSTLVDQPKSAVHAEGRIRIQMESGIEVSFPVGDNPRLSSGSHEQLNNVEISPYGIHWPDLDEDLSIRGILAGDFGQRPHRAA